MKKTIKLVKRNNSDQSINVRDIEIDVDVEKDKLKLYENKIRLKKTKQDVKKITTKKNNPSKYLFNVCKSLIEQKDTYTEKLKLSSNQQLIQDTLNDIEKKLESNLKEYIDIVEKKMENGANKYFIGKRKEFTQNTLNSILSIKTNNNKD